MPEGRNVNKMFGNIASRYDQANHWLSLGIDYYWRYRLMQRVRACQPQTVVDLATGSGDVAFCLSKYLPPQVKITGLDFCEPMLAQARNKQAHAPGSHNIKFAFGDCLSLPLASHTVDALTIAFGLRNLEDRHKGLQEMFRVLKLKSGRLFILEFSQPYIWFAPLYRFHLNYLIPALAGWLTGSPNAYQYLGNSIQHFPDHNALIQELRAAGFKHLRVRRLTLGIVAIHEAWA